MCIAYRQHCEKTFDGSQEVSTYLHIRHDKGDDLVLDALSHQTKAGSSCHRNIPDAFVSVLTWLLLCQLIQQHADQWL